MFGSRKSAATYGALFDVAADSIGAAIAASGSHDGVPEIVYGVRHSIDAASGSMESAFKKAAADLGSEGQKVLKSRDKKARLSSLIVCAASPWSVTQPIRLRKEEKTPFLVTSGLVRDLRQAESNELPAAPAFELVERSVVDVKVNGYDIAGYEGAEGTALDLTEVSNFVLKDMRAAAEKIAEREISHPEAEFTTHAFATYTVLRDAYPDMRTFCFVVVRGESTEIGLVLEDALAAVLPLPFGVQSLIRSLCEKERAPKGHASSKLCLYEEGMLSDEGLREIEAGFAQYAHELAQGFKQAASLHVIPRNIVVCAESLFEKALSRSVVETASKATGQIHELVMPEAVRLPGKPDMSLELLARFLLRRAEIGEA